MITWSYKLGWDKTNGGIYYFLDATQRSPEQLVKQQIAWDLCMHLMLYE
jgi:hypothetical protein